MSDISLRYLLYGQDISASKSVEGVATKGQKAAGIMSRAFGGLGNAVGGEVGQLASQVSGYLDNIGEGAKSMGEKLTIGGAAVTGIGAALTAFSGKDAAAQKQLEAAVTATGHSYSQYSSQIGHTVSKMADFAHGAADTKDALRILTQATNDPTKAMNNMSLVANLAAARHESLAVAAQAVARILGGSGGKTLTQYGITLKTTGDKTKDNELALAQLSAKLNGQASAAVDTFGGKFDILKTKLANVTEQIGEKLGPVLTAVGPTMMVVGTVMQLVAARQAEAAVATDTETTSTIAQTIASKASAVASKAMAAAQWLLNAALDANPIVLVVIAIAALVAGVIIAYKKSQTFRDIVHAAFHDVQQAGLDMWHAIQSVAHGIGVALSAISSAAGAVVSFVRSHWPLLLAILTGPFGLAVLFVSKHFDTIVGWVKSMPGRIKNAAVGMWDGISDAFKDAINFIIRGWNSLHFSLPSINTHIPGVGKIGGQTIGVPQIPYLAAGGIVTRPTVAMIGEAGPEAVVPLGHGGKYAGGITNQITITTGPMTTEGARELDQVLRRLFRQTGGALGYG